MTVESFTVKELVQELRTESKQSNATQAVILSTLEGINSHLGQLNSKVATHEKKINSLGTFQTKVMTVWGLAIFVVTTVITKLI